MQFWCSFLAKEKNVSDALFSLSLFHLSIFNKRKFGGKQKTMRNPTPKFCVLGKLRKTRCVENKTT